MTGWGWLTLISSLIAWAIVLLAIWAGLWYLTDDWDN